MKSIEADNEAHSAPSALLVPICEFTSGNVDRVCSVCVCLPVFVCVHMLLELRESCGVEECEFLSSRQQVRVRTECSSDRTGKRFADVCPLYQKERERCRRFLRDGVAAAHPWEGGGGVTWRCAPSPLCRRAWRPNHLVQKTSLCHSSSFSKRTMFCTFQTETVLFLAEFKRMLPRQDQKHGFMPSLPLESGSFQRPVLPGNFLFLVSCSHLD